MKYALNGELTIARAAKIKAELLQAVSAEGPFELDTTGVSEVDAAGLQTGEEPYTLAMVVRHRFVEVLRPGGFVFLGHSETTNGLSVPLSQVVPTVYRRGS